MKDRIIDNIPRAMSGPGKGLLENVHRPLLSVSTKYDRVSSYFSAYSFIQVLSELESLWKRGGIVRLILSPADQGIIGEAAAQIRKDFNAKKVWEMEISEIIKHLSSKSGKVTALKEAIAQGLLEVSVARPKVDSNEKYAYPPNFHSKFAIYDLGNSQTSSVEKFLHKIRAKKAFKKNKASEIRNSPFMVFHGSVNETGQAWDINIEDLSTHRSWVKGELDIACFFADRFEQIWSGLATDVEMLPLTEVFKKEIEKVIPEIKPVEVKFDVGFILQQQSRIPYSVAFSDNMWLFPHQARVANMSLNSEHVKIMFCDEVGLGKTFEALNVVEFKLVSKSINKILIAVPASLLEQWAITVNTFLKRSCNLFRANRFEEWNTLGEVSITESNEQQITIVSSHWLRRKTKAQVKDILNAYDFLVLDEAHHARCHDWEQKSGTKLWEKLFHNRNEIENILLLTATPYQTSKNDYTGLLGLLIELDKNMFSEIDSVQKLVTREQGWSMQKRLQLLNIIYSRFEHCRRYLSPDLITSIAQMPDSDLQTKTAIVRQHSTELDPLLMYKCSIMSQYTIRHTRDMIKDDFQFPKVHAENVVVELGKHAELIDRLNDFISLRMAANGFLKATYYQRCVSSLQAMKTSLENRLNRNQTKDVENEFTLEGIPVERPSNLNVEERGRISRLIEATDNAISEFGNDPKILKLEELVNDHTKHSRQIIMFSRFTATTKAIEEHFHQTSKLSVARYDGQIKRIRYSGKQKPVDVTREKIKSEMFDKKVDIIVCSDAASEGLNLQSASVLINVDVPWNPARLLQRIGRIDRLGQEAEEIFVYNLLYDNSIELQMYSVLDQRQTEGIRLLGEHPEIFSTASSREMFTPDYLEVERRVDEVQSELRTRATSESLEFYSPIGPSIFMNLLNQGGNFSLDPASGENFILNSEEIRKKEIDFSSHGINGKIGYIIDDMEYPHAICVNHNDVFLPLNLSTISLIISNEPVHSDEWTDITNCVRLYAQDFGYQKEIILTNPRFIEFEN